MFDTQPVIDQAARWLRSNPVPRNLEVKVLRERFGLSAIAACQAIAPGAQPSGSEGRRCSITG